MASLLPSRRRWQSLVFVFVLLMLGYTAWKRSLADPAHNHANNNRPPPSMLLQTPEILPAEYGTTARPPIKRLIHNAEMPAKLLPKMASDPAGANHEGRRLIFIGDVHGMLEPLKTLLEQISFDAAAGDHVVFTGDMITKGPDSVGVVEYAMDIGASSVRGNHEDRVLLAAEGLALDRRRRKHQRKKAHGDETDVLPSVDDEDQEPLNDDMEEEHFSHGNHKDRALARRLSTRQLEWLASLPVILKVGHLPNMGEVMTVHAGLVPGIPIDKQDPWAVMNMRTLIDVGKDVRVEFARQAIEDARRAKESDDEKKERINVGANEGVVQDLAARDSRSWDSDMFIPVASRDGQRWTKVWEKEMKSVAKALQKQDVNLAEMADAQNMVEYFEGEEADGIDADGHEKKNRKKHHPHRLMSVVFGHDSKRGLQMGKYSFGLDSGCVRGGQLTALIMEPSKSGKHIKTLTKSVDCKSAGRAAEDEDDF